MRIIDAHAHVYDKIAGITQHAPIASEKNGRVKIGTQLKQFIPPSFENSNSTIETLIAYMDWAGIEKAVLMSNPLYGYTNEYFLRCVEKYPDRLKAVTAVNFIEGKKAAEELAHLYDTTPLFGFKIEADSTFQCAPGKRMTDEEYMPVWDCVNQYHQTAFLHLFTDQQIADLAVLLERYPKITFVACHLGADGCFAPQADKKNFDFILKKAKKYKKLYFDTSYVPAFFQEEYPFPSSVKLIEKAYQTVGAERIMWGTDYPGMLNKATIFQLIDFVKVHCSIPEKDMELIMAGNATRLFF